MLENHGQPTLHEWNPNLTNRKITALIRATRVVGQFDGIKDSTTIGWPWLANDICDVRHHGGNVYWPPAWNCQNAKGCIVADKATGCEIWDRLRSAKWFRKWWEYKINPFCCRRTIVGALIVEWKFYSLHFDNTWLRINKW